MKPSITALSVGAPRSASSRDANSSNTIVKVYKLRMLRCQVTPGRRHALEGSQRVPKKCCVRQRRRFELGQRILNLGVGG